MIAAAYRGALRLAALGTTEQGESGTQFLVDYIKTGGAIGFYHRRLAGRLLLAVALVLPLLAAAEEPPVDSYLHEEEIVVTAHRRPTARQQVPAAVQVLTGEEIRNAGFGDLATALRYLAGVEVWQVTGSQREIGLLAYNGPLNPRVKLLLDGRHIGDPVNGATNLSILPFLVMDIERVEVVKGPNSALYGAGAFDGVINIITRPVGEGRFGAVLAGGERDTLEAGASWATRPAAGPEWLRVAARHDRGARLQTTPGVRASQHGMDSEGWTRLLADIGPRTPAPWQGRVTLFASDFSFNYAAVHAFGQIPADGQTVFAGADLTRQGESGERLALRTYGLYERYDLFPAASELNIEVATAALEGETTWFLSARQLLLLGGELRHFSARAAQVFAEPPRENRAALFVQTERTAGPRLHLVGALRGDYHPLMGTVPSLRAGLAWAVSDTHTMRLSAGTSYRIGSLAETYGAGTVDILPGVVAVRQLPATDLRAERVRSVELGWEWAATRHRLALAAYRGRLEDQVQVAFEPSGREEQTFRYANFPGYEFQGAELHALVQLHPRVELRAHYLLRRFDPKVIEGAGTPSAQVADAGLLVMPVADLRCGVFAHYTDRYLVFTGGGNLRIPSYTLLTATATHQTRRWLTLSLSAENLLDERHTEYGVTELGRRVLGRVEIRL